MPRILLVSLVALVTNAVCTLCIPLWLSNHQKKLPTTAPAELFNLDTLLFQVAFGIGLFLSILIDVRIAPKYMEKCIFEKMAKSAEKLQLFDILFIVKTTRS
jgi:hypothetical protein